MLRKYHFQHSVAHSITFLGVVYCTSPAWKADIVFIHPALDVQHLLPPIAPAIGSRIRLLSDAGDIEFLDSRIISIYLKMRNTSLVRCTAFCELSNVLLKCHRNESARNTWVRSIIVCVRHVQSMQCWWDGKEVAIGVVAVCFVKIEGVTCEHHFGDQSRSASDLICIRHGLAAIEDWRVECIYDVVQDLGIGIDCWR